MAGGTDMALCSDLRVIADDAHIGCPPARVWGGPTSALWALRAGGQRAERLLFTGDLLDGATALDWGLAVEAPPAAELDERFEALLQRVCLTRANQLVMMSPGQPGAVRGRGCRRRALGVLFDGIARHAPEGYAFPPAVVEPAANRPSASAPAVRRLARLRRRGYVGEP